jgi:hypothetical protein
VINSVRGGFLGMLGKNPSVSQVQPVKLRVVIFVVFSFHRDSSKTIG